jgi:hypothetical protein
MVLVSLQRLLKVVGGQHPEEPLTPVLLPSTPSEDNIFISYRYNLELAVKAMRAKGIDPVDKLPEHVRHDVIIGISTLDDALDYMAEEGYRGCSTIFMRPV